jgi:hypothetical protein
MKMPPARTAIWINALDPCAEEFRLLRNKGLCVYNAPRPIPGDICWEGDFRNGKFYAAGEHSKYGRDWTENLALPVNIVTNDEIERRVRFHGESHPLADRLEEFLNENGFKDLAANWLGMPYWAEATQPENHPED